MLIMTSILPPWSFVVYSIFASLQITWLAKLSDAKYIHEAETRKCNFQFSTKQTIFHLTSGVHLDSWCYVMTHSAVSQVKGYRSGPKDQKTSVVIFVKVQIVDSHSSFFFSYWPLHFPIFFNFLSVTPPKTVWYHLRTSVGTLSHRISTTVPLSYTSAAHLIWRFTAVLL